MESQTLVRFSAPHPEDLTPCQREALAHEQEQSELVAFPSNIPTSTKNIPGEFSCLFNQLLFMGSPWILTGSFWSLTGSLEKVPMQ